MVYLVDLNDLLTSANALPHFVSTEKKTKERGDSKRARGEGKKQQQLYTHDWVS